MFADLRDETFKSQPGAIFVVGPFGEPYINQFAGSGPSPVEFTFKAILVDGVVYIPSPRYALLTPKSQRDYSNYPMVIARPQPPVYAIREAS